MKRLFIFLFLLPLPGRAQQNVRTGTLYDELNARLVMKDTRNYDLNGKVRSITETERFISTGIKQPYDSVYTSEYRFSREGRLLFYTRQNESGTNILYHDSFVYHSPTGLLKEKISKNSNADHSSMYVSQYNAQGFLVSQQVASTSKRLYDKYTETYQARYIYNKDHSEVSIAYSTPAGYQKDKDTLYRFGFDKKGRLTRLFANGRLVTTISYHHKWNLPEWIISRWVCDSAETDCTYSYLHYSYDNKGRMVSKDVNEFVKNPVFLFRFCYGYEYNTHGGVSLNTIGAGNRKEMYGEEKVFRRETAWAFEYVYDERGNWIEKKEFYAADPANKTLSQVTKRTIVYY